MASVVKIKRSSVQGKKPTTSDIVSGELALNTRDGKMFSSDGTAVFEVGANLHSLSVGTGGLTIGNGAFTLPTTDGTAGYALTTDGNGNVTWEKGGEVTNAYLTSTFTTNTVFQSALANTNLHISTKLGATASVTLTGDVTGSGSFSANAVSITTQLADDVSTARLAVNNYVQFTPRDGQPHQEGRLFYHEEYKALTYFNDIADVALQIGLEDWIRVYNNTGSTIPNGTPVYATGSVGEVATIAPADATTYAKARVIGIATHDIANGVQGVATTRGLVSGIDTSHLTAGQTIHLAANGSIQTAAPTYPYFPTDLGECVVSDATNGYLRITIRQHSFEQFRVVNNMHVGGNITINGDLTVNGTQSIVSQNNLSIDNAFIYLNSGDAIGEAGTTFTGSGLDDAYFTGYFEGAQTTTYYVKIDSVGGGTAGVDTFSWSYDNFSTTEATGVDITGAEQALADNIGIRFNATTGHTLNDVWSGEASPIAVDTGWATHRNTGNTGVGYTHMGVFFDVSDDKFKFFDEYTPEVDGTIDTGHASFSFATVVADTFEGNLTGNANTASSLQTARTIALGGALTGSANFDGTSNITITGDVDLNALPANTAAIISTDYLAVHDSSANNTYKVSIADVVRAGGNTGSVSNNVIITTSSETVVDSWSATAFFSAKYIIQARSTVNTNQRQVSEVLLTHNGSATFLTEYGVLQTSVAIATIDSDISGGAVRLKVTPVIGSNTKIDVLRTTIVA
jgi:hypothetical protein